MYLVYLNTRQKIHYECRKDTRYVILINLQLNFINEINK